MTRIPAAVAGLALVAATAVACGTDSGADDPTATDSSTATDSPSPSPSPSASGSTTPSATATTSDDPVQSPIINKAVRSAIRDGYPALVPAGVPVGWTVVSATYDAKAGTWQIQLTDPAGAPVQLAQSEGSVEQLVKQYLPDGQPTGAVDLSAYGTGKWDSYTGMNAAALAKKLSGTSALVFGPNQDTVVDFTEGLLTAEDAGTGDGG
jgi:Protein of unknown function (DUF4245)